MADILVLNCGSTSLKAAIWRDGETVWQKSVTRIEEGGHPAALNAVLSELGDSFDIAGVGHRVVHGGDRFSEATRIDEQVFQAIEDLTPLAPLHNPSNLAGIRAARQQMPDVPHIAVFDTAFHSTLPRRARTYALPSALAAKHGIRRYGFHGTSHRLIAQRAAKWMETPLSKLRIITCHLGGGCSVAAVEYGRSVETSMGMTPLEGLVMGTRSGDLDPGALIHLARSAEMSLEELDTVLNKQSGLAGLSGTSGDLRDIIDRAADGDDAARLSISVFTHRLRKYIGAYAAVMGGVDAIVFSAGIGENSALIRHRVAQRLDFLGAHIDEAMNRQVDITDADPVAEFSAPHSRCRLLAVRTDEQSAIALEVKRLVDQLDRVPEPPKSIPIAISARHVHLSREALDALFGEGYELTERAPLSQPGQFAAEETVDLIGPKRTIERVRILGPLRPAVQVEVSRTDEFTLGIDAPVRDSGDVKNSPGITLRGPQRELHVKEGLICARRHIHMTPEDAEAFGVQNRDVVSVAVDSERRDLVFGDVLIRVSPKYRLEMHVDTDEGNAAELSRRGEGMLVPTSGTARILKRRSEAR
jgi:acetate kinase